MRIIPVQRHVPYSFYPCKRRLSHEPANSGQIRNHSGDVPERIQYKPGNEWGRLLEWSSSWSRRLRQPDDVKVWPKKSPWHGDRSYRTDTQWPKRSPWHGDRSSKRESLWPWHGERSAERESVPTWLGDRSSGRSHILLPQYNLREAEKEPLHQSTATPQWEHLSDDRSRPNFLGPPTVGK